MIDIKRRSFLFGAVATAVVVPMRKYFIMPKIEQPKVLLGPLTISRWEPHDPLTIEFRAAYDFVSDKNMISGNNTFKLSETGEKEFVVVRKNWSPGYGGAPLVADYSAMEIRKTMATPIDHGTLRWLT